MGAYFKKYIDSGDFCVSGVLVGEAVLQPGTAWEDELVLATFSNYIFPNAVLGHTSSPCAVFIRSRCLRPHRSFSSNRIHGESTGTQPSWLGLREARPLWAGQWSWAGEHPAPPSLVEHPAPPSLVEHPLRQAPWSSDALLRPKLVSSQSHDELHPVRSQPSSPPRTRAVSRGLHVPLRPSRRLHVFRGTFLEQ